MTFPRLLAVPLIVPWFGDTGPRQGLLLALAGMRKGPCSPAVPHPAPTPRVSCTGTKGHLGRAGLRAPLTLTTEFLLTPLPLGPAPLGRTPKAGMQGKLDMASLAGKPPTPYHIPVCRELCSLPTPSLLQLQLQRSSFRWGRVGSGSVWGGMRGHCSLDYVSLATKQSCINFSWMMTFKESINRNTKLLLSSDHLPATDGLPDTSCFHPQGRRVAWRPKLCWTGPTMPTFAGWNTAPTGLLRCGVAFA